MHTLYTTVYSLDPIIIVNHSVILIVGKLDKAKLLEIAKCSIEKVNSLECVNVLLEKMWKVCYPYPLKRSTVKQDRLPLIVLMAFNLKQILIPFLRKR